MAPEYNQSFQKRPNCLLGAIISIPMPKIHIKKLNVKIVKLVLMRSLFFLKNTIVASVKLDRAAKKADIARAFIFGS